MNFKVKNPFSIRAKSLSRYRVKGFGNREHEGASVGLMGHGDQLSLPMRNIYTYILYTIFGVVVFLLISRVVQLQVLEGNIYGILAEGNRVKIERTLAPRGIIYDRFLNPLLDNEPVFSLKIVHENIPQNEGERNLIAGRVNSLIVENSNLFGEDLKKITENINKIYGGGDDVLMVETVIPELNHEAAIAFQLENNLPGVLLEQGIKRTYLYPESLSHITGYLGKISDDEWVGLRGRGYYFGDLVGRSGIERQFEDDLRGIDRQVSVEINNLGEEQRIISERSLEAGTDLILTIDLDLQIKLYETLDEYAKQTSSKGAAVAMNPKTGEILALVSVPGFDANAFNSQDNEAISRILLDGRQPLFNRAVSGEYPPGSTFKPIVASAALENGLITPQTRFWSNGGLLLSDWFFPDWKAGGHGNVNLNQAMAESVNTYFYYISGGFEDFTGLGVAKINQHAKLYGLGQKLGIELGGEESGFLPSKEWKQEIKGESWYVGDTYHLGIGQGDILVTPLQLVNATTVLANGGSLLQPRLVKAKRVGGESQEIRQTSSRVVASEFISSETMNALRRSLRETVLSGSAVSLRLLPVTSAGKTGTAQVGGTQEPHGWFAGWAPYKQPEIVLVVLIENGMGGNISALPVFREVMQWYFMRNF